MQGENIKVHYKPIEPLHKYPFPWDKYAFFDVFPEVRLGIPVSGISKIDFSDVQDADLVVVAGQSWYLSPSLPLQSFFLDSDVQDYLRGRKIVFVNGCRNMWLMTARKIRKYISDIGGTLVGHIVLQDPAANLVSVLTIIRWLFYGKKEKSLLLPHSGVSRSDIAQSARFGLIIGKAVEADNYDNLQSKLLTANAIEYKPGVIFIEKIGHRIFGLWANFIRRKGESGDLRRRKWLMLFAAYLVVVLYIVSPFVSLFFYLTYPFRHISQDRINDCTNLSTLSSKELKTII